MEDLLQIWREYRPPELKTGSVVIDIGCSEGYFTDWAKSCGADVESYDVRLGIAVGPYDGVCDVVGEGLHAYIIPGKGQIPMVSLETILARHSAVDFLKCDIEGGEYMIFDCDISIVKAFGMEFHAWTTPDAPIEGLAVRRDPMPADAFNELLTRLRRTHIVEIIGDPAAGGYLHGVLKPDDAPSE